MKFRGVNQSQYELNRASERIMDRLFDRGLPVAGAHEVHVRDIISANAQMGFSHIYQNRSYTERVTLSLGEHANEFFYTYGDYDDDVSMGYMDNVETRKDISKNPEKVFRDTARDFLGTDIQALAEASDEDLAGSIDLVRKLLSLKDMDKVAEEYTAVTGYVPDPALIKQLKEFYQANARVIEGCAQKIEYISSELYGPLGTDLNVLGQLSVKAGFTRPNDAQTELINAGMAYADGCYKIMSAQADKRMKEDPEPPRHEHNLVIDITGKNYKTYGGSMNSRLKVGFKTPGGEMIQGYFTESNVYDSLTDYHDAARRTGEIYPQYKVITDEIADYPNADFAMNAILALNTNFSIKAQLDRYVDPKSPMFNNNYVNDMWNNLISTGFVDNDTYAEMVKRPDFEMFTYDLMSALIPPAEKHFSNETVGLRRGDNANRRNNAMTQVAELLGQPDRLAQSVNMTVVDGNKKFNGTFMYNARGIDLYHADPVNNPELAGRVVELSPEGLRQISDLTIIDFICGNVDRHRGNLMYQMDFSQPGKAVIVGVQGIDNDMSFVDKHDGVKQMSRLSDIKVMSADMARAVLDMDSDDLEIIMRRAGINNDEMLAAYVRLQRLQNRISQKEVRIVKDDDWKNCKLNEIGDTDAKANDTFHQVSDMINTWNGRIMHNPAVKKPDEVIEAAVNETGAARFHLEAQAQELRNVRSTLVANDPKAHINRSAYRAMFRALDKVIDQSERMAAQKDQPSDMQYNVLAESYKALADAAAEYVVDHPGTRKHEFGRLRVDIAKNLQIMAYDFRRAAFEDTLKNFNETMKAMEKNINANPVPQVPAHQAPAEAPQVPAQEPADTLVKGRTVYGSLTVTEAQMKEIQTQGISEYLTFDRLPDGKYGMRTVIPKEGVLNGKTYQIRECLNIIGKTLANKILTSNGSVDLVIADKASEDGAADINKARNFLASLNIPAGKKDQVMQFYDAFSGVVYKYMQGLCETTCTHLSRYRAIMAKTIAETDPQKKAAMGKIIGSRYQDYVNHIESIRELAKIDPATETRILVDLDCEASATINRTLMDAVEGKVLLDNKKPINFDGLRISMSNGKKNLKRGQSTAFDEHYVFGGNVTIDGKTMFLSLETTASPAGDFLFRPEVGATGIGLYENEDEMRYYHQWNNNLLYENPEAMNALCGTRYRQEGTVTYGEPAMLQAKAFARTTTHNIDELVERLDNPLVNAGNGKRTSPNFEAMNAAVRRYNETRDIADLEEIRQTAKKYLLGKIPKDGSKRVADYSRYTRNRIEAAADILEFAAASQSPALLKANLNDMARQAHHNLVNLVKAGNAENAAGNARKDLATMLACKELSSRVDKLLQSKDITNANLDMLTNPRIVEDLTKGIMDSPAFTTAINTIGKQGIENIVKQGNTNNSPEFAVLDDAFIAASKDLSLNAKAPKAEEKEQINNPEANNILGQ